MKARIAILLLLPTLLFGQTDSSSFSIWPSKAYFKSYLTDTKALITSPSRFDGKDWLKAGAVTAAGILTLTQDKPVNRFFQDRTKPFMDDLSRFGFEPIGRGIYPVLLSGGLYLHATVKQNAYDRKVALHAVKAMVISGLFTQTAKQLFHRHRPEHPNPGKWEGPIAPIRFRSFPSGHSTMAFAAATFFAEAYSDKNWIPVAAYTMATLAAASRMYDNKHWFSDVFFGSAIGYFTAKAIYHQNFTNQESPLNIGLQYSGLGVSYRF